MNGKIVLGLIGFFVLILSGGCCYALSADVGGWTFTSDVEGWRVSDVVEIHPYDSTSENDQPTCGVRGAWNGVWGADFGYPTYPNAPKDNDEYHAATGWGEIFVLKVPDDLRAELQSHDVAVYGSVDKIPADAKEQEINDILKDATRNSDWCKDFKSDKDIDFNGYKAHLAEGDPLGSSCGAIAVLLDDNTVGIIEVNTDTNPGNGGNGAYFDGRAWDVIETFTITPKS